MIELDTVKHIADLARLNIKDEEYPKYQQQLSDIMQDIERIIEVEIPDVEIMISPTVNSNVINEDRIGYHLSKENIFRNAKNVKGDYISVVKVRE